MKRTIKIGCVACHEHGTGLSRVLPWSWDHLGCQLWDHRRVVRRFGAGLLLAITPCRVAWRSLVAFREVRVNEVREVLRCWLAGDGLHTAAERAGVDRDGGVEQLCDALIGAVIGAVRPARASGHGAAWESLLAHEQQIRDWIEHDDLQLTNIHGKLTRRRVVVPYRTSRCPPLVSGLPRAGVDSCCGETANLTEQAPLGVMGEGVGLDDGEQETQSLAVATRSSVGDSRTRAHTGDRCTPNCGCIALRMTMRHRACSIIGGGNMSWRHLPPAGPRRRSVITGPAS